MACKNRDFDDFKGMLSFSEEIVLLALDEKSGTRIPLPESSLEFAVAGALLLELAFINRLDTDNEFIKIFDRADTGDYALNKAMGMLPSEKNLTIKRALSILAAQGDFFINTALMTLVTKGVLEKRENHFLWILTDKRFPVADNRPVIQARERIKSLILNSAEIPSPQDVVLVALCDVCGILTSILTPEEISSARERIEAIAKMDFIAQEISKSLQEIQRAIIDAIVLSGLQ